MFYWKFRHEILVKNRHWYSRQEIKQYLNYNFVRKSTEIESSVIRHDFRAELFIEHFE